MKACKQVEEDLHDLERESHWLAPPGLCLMESGLRLLVLAPVVNPAVGQRGMRRESILTYLLLWRSTVAGGAALLRNSVHPQTLGPGSVFG